MALQPRKTLDEHPKQQKRKATSIRYMYNTIGINGDNCTSYAMKIDNCTIVDATDKTGYVFSDTTGIYFKYNGISYYLTPTINAPGLTESLEFYISDFINNYHTDLFLATMQSYVQQTMYVLVQKFENNEIYCLLNDLFAIQKYISYYGNYQFITPEWTTDQKNVIPLWIKGENRTDIRNVDLIDDSMKSFVVDAHITTSVHTDMTDKQFRQLTAQAYKYRRTYDKWFGLQYVPWSNSDSETSDIVYCNHEGNAVTDADYDSTDKDVYTEIRYEYGGNRYPIRTIEAITPSIEYRQQQFEKAMRYLNMEGLVTDEYGFSHPGNFLLWFRRVTEMLCTDTVKSLVELMTEVENGHYYCDDYLNTSIKVLYDEIDFIANCYKGIFNTQINDIRVYDYINRTFGSSETILPQLTTFNKFYITWIDQNYRDKIWNETDGYYYNITRIASGDRRNDLWNSIYELIPDSFSFDDVDGISSFRYGYTQEMLNSDLKYVHEGLIINKTEVNAIGTINYDQGFLIGYGNNNYSNIYIQANADGTVINFIAWMYIIDPVLQEKSLITIEPFLPDYGTCFLSNDFAILSNWLNLLHIDDDPTIQINQTDVLKEIHNAKENNSEFRNSAKCKYTDLLCIYEIYAKVANDTVVRSVLNLKVKQYQPTLASTTGYPLIFSYGEPPETGYQTTTPTELPDIFIAQGSDVYININGIQKKKLIWIDYTKDNNSLFIPILQMDWTVDYRRYLDLDIEPYINNLIDALEHAENNNEFGEENERVKQLYILFMEQMTRIQNAIIEQFIRIATECCTELIQNDQIYKLESYLYDELELFDTVFKKYIAIENEINKFVDDNLGSINHVYNYSENNSDITYEEMTFYRKTEQYINALTNAKLNESEIFNSTDNISRAYPYTEEGITNSHSRKTWWNLFGENCGLISKIYENSIRPTLISDIRNYVNAPSDFSWIFANTADLVMSDYDLSNYTDLDKDYSTYTKYKLTE